MKLERRLFHSLFAFEDQKEGMAAFVEKRQARLQGTTETPAVGLTLARPSRISAPPEFRAAARLGRPPS